MSRLKVGLALRCMFGRCAPPALRGACIAGQGWLLLHDKAGGQGGPASEAGVRHPGTPGLAPRLQQHCGALPARNQIIFYNKNEKLFDQLMYKILKPTNIEYYI